MSISLLLFVLSIVSSGGGQQGETEIYIAMSHLHCSQSLATIAYNNNSDSLLTSNFQCIAFLQPLLVKCIHQTTHLVILT